MEPAPAQEGSIYSVQELLRARHERSGSMAGRVYKQCRTMRMRTVADLEREAKEARAAARRAGPAAAVVEAGVGTAIDDDDTGLYDGAGHPPCCTCPCHGAPRHAAASPPRATAPKTSASASKATKAAATAPTQQPGYVLGGNGVPSKQVVSSSVTLQDFARIVGEFLRERNLTGDFSEYTRVCASSAAPRALPPLAETRSARPPRAEAAATPTTTTTLSRFADALGLTRAGEEARARERARSDALGTVRPPPFAAQTVPASTASTASTASPSESSNTQREKRSAETSLSMFERLARSSTAKRARPAYAAAPPQLQAQNAPTSLDDAEFARVLEKLRAPIDGAASFPRGVAPWDTVDVGGRTIHRFLCSVPRASRADGTDGASDDSGAGDGADADGEDHEIIGYVSSELAELLGADRIAEMRAASPAPESGAIRVDARLFASLQLARVGMPDAGGAARTRRQTELALAAAPPLTPLSMLVSWALTSKHTVVTLASTRRKRARDE